MRLESPTTLAPSPTLAPGSAALRAQFPLLQQVIHGAPPLQRVVHIEFCRMGRHAHAPRNSHLPST